MAGCGNMLFNPVNVIKSPLIRYGHKMRGKPPTIARSLKQRLSDENPQDISLTFKVDIGFRLPKLSRQDRLKEHSEFKQRKQERTLEKLSRTQKLSVPLDKVKEEWSKSLAPYQIKTAAEHYGVFEHLFGDAYFYPQVMLDVLYKQKEEDLYMKVHRGNVIKPSEATAAPDVSYTADPATLWTLVLTNPDGHFSSDDSEYVHWFVGNIPGSDVSKGDVVWDYLQPFPPRGTGFHRFVFVLYKQEKRMDYSSLKKEQPCVNLSERTFRTQDFYRERQDDITPAGLAFFQSDWDRSLTDFYHNTLNMKEPVFEYDFPPPYIRPQVLFPLRQPFNLYMDKYRDEKQIAKEFLLRKLKNVHPFRKPDPPLKYPNAVPLDNSKVPSWLRTEIKKARLGWGRINDY
ncbi:large ribosomal subunit protein mL38 [Bacillus rossius redtenbacheri]|uniref:large ribosomal subunit protein mL38 n=1 Tax=Bacillus rossius redtenbacheri TaxID=93214 RepID=UPI002FDEB601